MCIPATYLSNTYVHTYIYTYLHTYIHIHTTVFMYVVMYLYLCTIYIVIHFTSFSLKHIVCVRVSNDLALLKLYVNSR